MTASLRILALNWRCVHHPQAGGAEINLFEQARRWVRDGHQVTVFCGNPGGERALPRAETIDGVEVRRRGGRFTVYIYAALYLIRHGHTFDRILDVANGIPFFTPLFTRMPGSLLIHHVHDRQWFSEFPFVVAVIGRFLEQRVVPLVYRTWPVIAVSSTTRDGLLRMGFKRSRIHIIHNGMIQPDPSSPENTPAKTGRRVVYVGRLKRYKRLDLLVHALAALRHTFPDIHLDIVGDGDARPAIEALIARLGVGSNVTLHGYVDEARKTDMLRAATVFATPSMHEGWGLSVIEANAYGCPAVAYDVPGLRAAIRHGETGWLAADDEGFRHGLSFLLRDTVTRERYATAARAWARRFTWDACASDTLDVLSSAGRDARAGTVPSAGAPRAALYAADAMPTDHPDRRRDTVGMADSAV